VNKADYKDRRCRRGGTLAGGLADSAMHCGCMRRDRFDDMADHRGRLPCPCGRSIHEVKLKTTALPALLITKQRRLALFRVQHVTRRCTPRRSVFVGYVMCQVS